MEHGKESPGARKPGMEDLLFGLFLIALAIFVYTATNSMNTGTAADMGPAYCPKAVSLLMGAFGGFFALRSFFIAGPKITPPFWRGLILIPLAAGVFALLMNVAGLLISAFLAMVIASMASKETRPLEVLVFSACMSTGCVLLFVKALALPAPIFPW